MATSQVGVMTPKWTQIAPCTYELPQEEGMRVPGLIIASERLLEEVDIERPLQQVRNVAHLPGILGHSIAMPDIHWGYGFPIGGVAAVDVAEGVISPGGVGYDINCGVRLAIAPLLYADLKKKKALLEEIFRRVPAGVGQGHQGKNLSDHDYSQLLTRGARWSVDQGMGFAEDLEHCESAGTLEGADPQAVSETAKTRGKKQLGSIGSGNHFVELGEIQTLFAPEIAAAWGVEAGALYILIHSGSRGFGHQICQDTLTHFHQSGLAKGLPDPQLVAAPIQSADGQRYFAAMACAANYAFNNRQQILHHIRAAFHAVLGTPPQHIRLLYDVCHNIAKFETHQGKRVCVHRKGATRAFGPHAPELSPLFQSTGQPVLVPGDMGRASHLMTGLGNPLTWASAAHGAGRARSRIKSLKAWQGRDPLDWMREKGVDVRASSLRTISEEMPDAYKDVDLVVEATEEAGLAKRVARLRPHLVVKG